MFGNAKITVKGRLGKDVELRQVGQGTDLARTTMAVDQGKKSDNKPAMWLQLKAWKYGARLLAAYSKGDSVIVYGELEEESWQAKGGTDKKTLTVNVEWVAKQVFPERESEAHSDYSYPENDSDEPVPF